MIAPDTMHKSETNCIVDGRARKQDGRAIAKKRGGEADIVSVHHDELMSYLFVIKRKTAFAFN